MQVRNILFRLSNLLNLNFAHLNDHLQTILQFEGDKVALTHIIKDKDTDPEDIAEALIDINDLFPVSLGAEIGENAMSVMEKQQSEGGQAGLDVVKWGSTTNGKRNAGEKSESHWL